MITIIITYIFYIASVLFSAPEKFKKKVQGFVMFNRILYKIKNKQ